MSKNARTIVDEWYEENGSIEYFDEAQAPYVHIVLLDQNEQTRSMLTYWLSNITPSMQSVWSYRDIDEMAEHDQQLRKQTHVIYLVNLHEGCPMEPEGSQFLADLKKRIADRPLCVVSSCNSKDHIQATLESGIRGFIPVNCKPLLLVKAMQMIMAGGLFIPADFFLRPSENMVADDHSPLQGLTRREHEVFSHLKQGKANKYIAYSLGMHESTVKVHVRNIMRKLKASNRTHAVFIASNPSSAAISDDDRMSSTAITGA